MEYLFEFKHSQYGRIKMYNYLFDGDGESQVTGKFRNFDNLFSDLSPAPTNSSARDNASPWRPRAIRRLDFGQNLSQQLLRQVRPAARRRRAAGHVVVRRVADHAVRPPPHHVMNYAFYCHTRSRRDLILILIFIYFEKALWFVGEVDGWLKNTWEMMRIQIEIRVESSSACACALL